jgi:hypothetical protein
MKCLVGLVLVSLMLTGCDAARFGSAGASSQGPQNQVAGIPNSPVVDVPPAIIPPAPTVDIGPTNPPGPSSSPMPNPAPEVPPPNISGPNIPSPTPAPHSGNSNSASHSNSNSSSRSCDNGSSDRDGKGSKPKAMVRAEEFVLLQTSDPQLAATLAKENECYIKHGGGNGVALCPSAPARAPKEQICIKAAAVGAFISSEAGANFRLGKCR